MQNYWKQIPSFYYYSNNKYLFKKTNSDNLFKL